MATGSIHLFCSWSPRRNSRRALKGLSEEDAIRATVAHELHQLEHWASGLAGTALFLYYGQGLMPFPEVQEAFAYGAPASTPPLRQVLNYWRKITSAADPWLKSLSTQKLQEQVIKMVSPSSACSATCSSGQSIITGQRSENLAIRQMLGHTGLPDFVGNIDRLAPYTPE